MPQVVIIYLKNLPECTFLRVKMELMLPQDAKDLLLVVCMLHFLPCLHHHAFDINLYCSADQFLEYMCDHPLMRSPRILQSKRHHRVMIIPLRCYKGSLFLILKG